MDVIRYFETSVTGKALFIGALVLTLLVPLGMIERLIAERSLSYQAARADIGRTWGQRQTIGGPILIVPVRPPSGGYPVANEDFYILPDELDIVSDAQVQVLARGIYRVPVYNARVRISGRSALPADFPRSDVEFLWDQAVIALPISDARSIREPVRFTAGGASASFRPGGTRVAGFGPQLAAQFCRSRRQTAVDPLRLLDRRCARWLGLARVPPARHRDARDREGRFARVRAAEARTCRSNAA